MLFSVKEMELLCVFHSGTLSATLDLLREAENEPPEKMELVKGVIEKLSAMKPSDTASLAFEPEK